MMSGTIFDRRPLGLVMVTETMTALLEHDVPDRVLFDPEPLLREALGGALRSFRADKGITLRELAEISCVSPGYLSELERGRKEVSSEVLAAICHALDTRVSDVLLEAAGAMAVTSADADLAAVRSVCR